MYDKFKKNRLLSHNHQQPLFGDHKGSTSTNTTVYRASHYNNRRETSIEKKHYLNSNTRTHPNTDFQISAESTVKFGKDGHKHSNSSLALTKKHLRNNNSIAILEEPRKYNINTSNVQKNTQNRSTKQSTQNGTYIPKPQIPNPYPKSPTNQTNAKPILFQKKQQFHHIFGTGVERYSVDSQSNTKQNGKIDRILKRRFEKRNLPSYIAQNKNEVHEVYPVNKLMLEEDKTVDVMDSKEKEYCKKFGKRRNKSEICNKLSKYIGNDSSRNRKQKEQTSDLGNSQRNSNFDYMKSFRNKLTHQNDICNRNPLIRDGDLDPKLKYSQYKCEKDRREEIRKIYQNIRRTSEKYSQFIADQNNSLDILKREVLSLNKEISTSAHHPKTPSYPQQINLVYKKLVNQNKAKNTVLTTEESIPYNKSSPNSRLLTKLGPTSYKKVEQPNSLFHQYMTNSEDRDKIKRKKTIAKTEISNEDSVQKKNYNSRKSKSKDESSSHQKSKQEYMKHLYDLRKQNMRTIKNPLSEQKMHKIKSKIIDYLKSKNSDKMEISISEVIKIRKKLEEQLQQKEKQQDNEENEESENIPLASNHPSIQNLRSIENNKERIFKRNESVPTFRLITPKANIEELDKNPKSQKVLDKSAPEFEIFSSPQTIDSKKFRTPLIMRRSQRELHEEDELLDENLLNKNNSKYNLIFSSGSKNSKLPIFSQEQQELVQKKRELLSYYNRYKHFIKPRNRKIISPGYSMPVQYNPSIKKSSILQEAIVSKSPKRERDLSNDSFSPSKISNFEMKSFQKGRDHSLESPSGRKANKSMNEKFIMARTQFGGTLRAKHNKSDFQYFDNLSHLDDVTSKPYYLPDWLLEMEDFQQHYMKKDVDYNIFRVCKKDPLLRNADERKCFIQYAYTFKFFQKIPRLVLAKVCELFKPIKFAKGEALMKKGDEGDKMFLITKGLVGIYMKVDKSGNIAGEPIAQSGKDSIVGETALRENCVRTASVIALQNTKCLYLTREDYNEAFRIQDKINLFERLRIENILMND